MTGGDGSSVQAGAERLPGFDGARALAAGAIFVYHVASVGRFPLNHPAVWNVVGELNAGVAVFFVLSGFLLYLPFAGRDGHRGVPRAREFLLRRGARVFPAYWIALAATLFFLAPAQQFLDLGQALSNVFLVHLYFDKHLALFFGLSHSWTLVVEVSFYAALPILALLIRRLARSRGSVAAEGVVLASVAGVGIAADAIDTWFDPWRGLAGLPDNLAPFAAGMALAVAWVNRRSSRDWASHLRRGVTRLGWGGACAVLVAAVALPGAPSSAAPTWTFFGRHLLQTLLGTLVVGTIAFGDTKTASMHRLLQSRVVQFLGRISYGIYLWHLPLLWYVERTSHAEGFAFVLRASVPVALASVGLAWLSYRFVETPAIARSRRCFSADGARGVSTRG